MNNKEQLFQGVKDLVDNGDKQITIDDIRKVIPQELFKKNEIRFMISVLFSVSSTLTIGYLGLNYIPLKAAFIPIWIIYSIICGTVATGIWVLGHECGHHSFSNNNLLNDGLGYILHTVLLVPYFSWQWSHNIHHRKCNHLTQGETHVPLPKENPKAKKLMIFRSIIGVESFSIYQLFTILVIGWPLYLLFGFSGGPARGFTSHFIVPNQLFPKSKLLDVGISNLGLAFFIYLLYLWAQATCFSQVIAVYIGPYLIVNAYLTGITFLQHTDEEIPHLDEIGWTWLKGALCTIDRNYPEFINALQFDIGSTHVTHHLFPEMPHYNARIANIYVKQILGKLYYRDKKSISRSLFENAKLACVEHRDNGVWKYI